MNAKRRNFNKLRAVLGRSAFVAISASMIAAMFLAPRPAAPANQTPKSPKKTVRYKKNTFPVTKTDSVAFQYDTVRVNGNKYYARNGWRHGEYSREKNVAHVRVIVDTATDTSPKAANFIAEFNAKKNRTAYHEIRHGMNASWMGRVGHVDSIMLVADEYWARVAGSLAGELKMECPQSRYLPANVNYKIDGFYQFVTIFSRPVFDTRLMRMRTQYYAIGVLPQVRKVADASLECATKELTAYFDVYAACQFKVRDVTRENFRASAEQNANRKILYEQALDSMSMFRINGRMVPITALASPDVQARTDSFLYCIAPRDLAERAKKR